MVRPPLPTVGSDDDVWGDLNNDVLEDLQSTADDHEDRMTTIEAALGLGETAGEFPSYQSGRFYGPEPWRSSAAPSVYEHGADHIALSPWMVPADSYIDRVYVHVEDDGGAGQEVIVGQFRQLADGTLELAHVFGAIDCDVADDTSAYVEFAVVAPDPGFTWLAILNSGTGALSLRSRLNEGTWDWFGGDSPFVVRENPYYATGSPIAALPATLPAFTDSDYTEDGADIVQFNVRGATAP